MSTQVPQSISEEIPASEGRAWVRPAFVRLETGEAEAADGVGTDSSGFVS